MPPASGPSSLPVQATRVPLVVVVGLRVRREGPLDQSQHRLLDEGNHGHN